jgi:hypothetical protein
MGKCLLTRSSPLPGLPTVGVSDPGDPQPDRPVNLSLRAPAQMGWSKMEHKACIISHRGAARSRGYKRRERVFVCPARDLL